MQHIENEMGEIPANIYDVVRKSVEIIANFAQRGDKAGAERFLMLMDQI